MFLTRCSMRLSALAAGKKAACPARPRAGLSRAATHPRSGGQGAEPPLGGMEGGTAPSRGVATSLKSGQLLPAVRRKDNVGFPCTLAYFRPSEETELPLLP